MKETMKTQFATNIQCIKNIIWYDGPLISYCKAQDTNYIVAWMPDTQENPKEHEWLTIEVSNADLEIYFAGESTLLDLQKKSLKMYKCVGQFIDDDENAWGEIIEFSDLPKDWKARKDSSLGPFSLVIIE